MAKYDKFGEFLSRQRAARVEISFGEVERVIGAKLPPSAYKHRPWWSNNPRNNALTQVWLDAGYESAGVDLTQRRLTFRRTVPPQAEGKQPGKAKSAIEQLHGALKGMLQWDDDLDLTAPALPEWADSMDAKWGKEPTKRVVR